MSLDCFPLVKGQSIGLQEQPMALDIAYEQNLLVTVIESCQTVVVYELHGEQGDRNNSLGSFSLGKGIVVDRVAYCALGDYIACIGHNNGSMALHVVFSWRLTPDDTGGGSKQQPRIEELELSQSTTPIDVVDRRNRLDSIGVCQRTGNLAASYGDLVVIYQYNSKMQHNGENLESETVDQRDEEASQHSSDDLDKLNELTRPSRQFNHIISLKLSIWAHSISLVENYLSLTTSDHVQVLKLELLTLQIQSDGQNDQSSNFQTNQTNRSSSGSSGDSRPLAGKSRRASATAVSSRNHRVLLGSGGEDMNVASTTTASSGAETNSIMSDSNNSTTTNFSAFNTTGTTTTNTTTSATMPAQLAAGESSDGETAGGCGNQSLDQANNDSDMSIITMNHQIASLLAPAEEPAGPARIGGSHDDCITWNLNTKKLVKLPSLMHNTSSDLSSFHICHPLELLGPACESIACRVLARLYSADFCQNQLEAVVLLCRQFDSDRDPVKSTHLQPVYLSSLDDQKRLSRYVGATDSTAAAADQLNTSPQEEGHLLLKSQDHELLASVTFFAATLYKCFVYSLHGKKVARIQTITHPAMCLDLRPDLLNVYVLTTPGLQICSTGLCDSTFRYDWSSSADLNLSFVACDRVRVLATSRYLVLVASLQQKNASDSSPEGCFIEVWQKPTLSELFKRIVYINKRCQSISIRSNLLTYLHACAQLSLISNQISESARQDDITSSIELLRGIAIMLCKELLHKKQTNVITNGRIDKVIKHLLDISYCDLKVLMSRHIEKLRSDAREGIGSAPGENAPPREQTICYIDERSYSDDELGTDDEQPLDSDYELLTIYLRYVKYQPFILAYLQANATDELICKRIITYMFEHNSRLLIKCAQRFARANSRLHQHEICVNLLIERLKQLAGLDSTGINRATVLFTLANLYNASENQRQLAIATLGQIKPRSHLAITMCSNHEIIDRPMAELVAEHHPEVYKLFLTKLGAMAMPFEKRCYSGECVFPSSS